MIKEKKHRFTNLWNVKKIMIKITYDCNLRCYMCGQTRIRLSRSDQPRREPLSITEWKDFFDRIGKFPFLNPPLIMIWGGEPFLYPKLIDLIKYIKTKGLNLYILTNGTLLEKYAEDLVANRVDAITISVDGPEEIHDKIRGVKGAYKRIMKGIKHINNLKKYINQKPLLHIVYTINNLNYKYLENIAQKVYELGGISIDYDLPTFIDEKIGDAYANILKKYFKCKGESWIGFINPSISNIDLPVLIDQIKRIREKYKDIGQLLHNLSLGQIKRYFKDPYYAITKVCSVINSTVSIEPNGDVVSCPDFPDYVVGNIKNESNYGKIWAGLRFRKFRDFFEKNGPLPICFKCFALR